LVFNSGLERASYLLNLHELLQNTRRRGTRQDWAREFKRFMRWLLGEQIERVDGSHAILILRQAANMTPEHFQEKKLDELLRAALAGIVSALDRYCHDLIISRVLRELRRSEKNINKELRQLRIPVLAAKSAVHHARLRRGKGGRVRPRPMSIVRHAVQDVLHRDATYQRPSDISRGLRLVGIENVWQTCARRMRCRADDIIKRLDRIVDRRNKIVHEGDVEQRRKGGRPTLHPLDKSQIRQDIDWVARLVNAIEAASDQ